MRILVSIVPLDCLLFLFSLSTEPLALTALPESNSPKLSFAPQEIVYNYVESDTQSSDSVRIGTAEILISNIRNNSFYVTLTTSEECVLKETPPFNFQMIGPNKSSLPCCLISLEKNNARIVYNGTKVIEVTRSKESESRVSIFINLNGERLKNGSAGSYNCTFLASLYVIN